MLNRSILGGLLVAACLMISPCRADSQEPGTTADPLVSKSYLEQMFHFRSMVIPAGENLTVNFGAMLVLRSGRLKLRCPKGKALVDLTSGEKVLPDAFIPPNHLILVPDSAKYSLEAQTLTLILGMGIPPEK